MTSFNGRHDYTLGSLSEITVAAKPLMQFHSWMSDAAACDQINEPYAMAVATASAEGRPSVRMVLLRDASAEGFVFFTNYESRKGEEISANAFGALLFYWAPLERQIRIEGRFKRVSEADSDRYFATRPFESRLGALASRQSREIEGRDAIDAAYAQLASQYPPGSNVPKPETWGGYRLVPDRFEFWQGRPNRLHDRIVYERDEERADDWRILRLAP